jgi:thymidylate kinase
MIIVLEGVNGSGKSEVGKALAAELKAPLWRPFRPNPETHWDARLGGQHNQGEVGENLRALGVPLNTFCDDLYVADALRTLRPEHVILDRSLPSSIAYGRVQGEEWLKDDEMLQWIWTYWEGLLKEAGDPVWVQLHAPYEVTLERCGKRWHPNKETWNKLNNSYTRLLNWSTFDNRMVINTGQTSIRAIVKRVTCDRAR